MRLISLLAILMFALGCSKKDVRMIRQYLNKNACTAISINPDSVNTNDFFMIKTFSDNGLLSILRPRQETFITINFNLIMT